MDYSNIRKFRKQANKSQDDLARVLGVNRATVSKYESGTIEPTFSQLEKIALCLGVNIADLTGMESFSSGAEFKKRWDALVSNTGEPVTTGERIKAARKRAGLTQKELGEKLGIAYQTLAQWETGARKPKAETLRRIADALDVTMMDLDERFAWQPDNEIRIIEPQEDELREEVKALTYSLNPKGLSKTRDYMHDLMQNPENTERK